MTVTEDTTDTAAPDEGLGEDVAQEDVLTGVCWPNALKGECGTPTALLQCNAEGTGWEEIACAEGEYCYEGECKTLACPPNGTMCGDLKTVLKCVEQEDGTYDWVEDEDCGASICNSGACVGGCKHNVKLNQYQDCASWDVNLTPEPGETCNTDNLLVVPSSAANKLAVFDIAENPPVLYPGSPFATCSDPSRILMDGDTNVIASCRGDGKINKHLATGELLWSHQLTACTGARGVVIAPGDRLFAGCSSNSKVYELEPATGDELGSLSVTGYTYGLSADEDGVYVAALGESVAKITLGGVDDFTLAWENKTVQPYGLTVDGAGQVWLGGPMIAVIDTTDGSLVETYDPGSYTHGISVGIDGNIYAALGDANKVARLTPGDPIAQQDLFIPPGDQHPRGLALDADSNVYTINMFSNTISRIDGVTGESVTAGVGALSSPYGYSGDMTGLTSGCLISGTSVWKSELVDMGSPGSTLLFVRWKAIEPQGTLVKVFYRLDTGPWIHIPSSSKPINEKGQFLQIKATLVSDDPEVTPTLEWVMGVWEK